MLRKLKESEKSYWGMGDYGIVEDGKVLFQGSYEGCLQWLSAGSPKIINQIPTFSHIVSLNN